MSGRSIARSLGNERGVALVTALLGTMMLILMIGGIVAATTSAIRSSGSHEREAAALLIAEAGGAHAMGLVRDLALPPGGGARFNAVLLGPDGAPNTADDGWLGGPCSPPVRLSLRRLAPSWPGRSRPAVFRLTPCRSRLATAATSRARSTMTTPS